MNRSLRFRWGWTVISGAVVLALLYFAVFRRWGGVHDQMLDELEKCFDRAVVARFERVTIDFDRIQNPHLQGRVSFDGQFQTNDLLKGWCYFESHVVSVGDTHLRPRKGELDFPCADLDLRFSTHPEHEWAYLHVRELSGPLIDRYEFLKSLPSTTRFGVYFTELDELMGPDDSATAGAPQEHTAAGLLGRTFLQFRRRETLQRLVRNLRASAGAFTVEYRADGLNIIKAAQLKSMGADFEWVRLYEQAEIQIGYKPGEGVHWLRILHFGEDDGTVTYQFRDAPVDEQEVYLMHQLLQHPAPVVPLKTTARVLEWLAPYLRDRTPNAP